MFLERNPVLSYQIIIIKFDVTSFLLQIPTRSFNSGEFVAGELVSGELVSGELVLGGLEKVRSDCNSI